MRNPRTLISIISILLLLLLGLGQFVDIKTSLIIGISFLTILHLSHWLLKRQRAGDPLLLVIVSLIAIIGLTLQLRLDSSIGLKHFSWYLIGMLGYMITSHSFHKVHTKLRSFWPLWALTVLLMALTQVFGSTINGAKNWLLIGPISIQVSEFIKPIILLALASFCYNPIALMPKHGKKITGKLNPEHLMMASIYVILALFLVQRELGSALLTFLVYLSVVFVFHYNKGFILLNLACAGFLGLAATMLFSHVQVRLTAWLNPFSDIANRGYQIAQSLFAIGSGGYFGVGIGQGYPEYVPNVMTDLVFSALCEEMGIFMGIGLLLLYLLLIYRGVKISMRLKDPFTKALAFGIALTFGYQCFIIIGGITRLVPLTGITLPFMSYGGSSMIISFMLLGLLQSLSGPILKQEVTDNEAIHHA